MVKKITRFDVMSKKKCKKCGRPLKVNVAERKPTADLCYNHYREDERINHNGHIITPHINGVYRRQKIRKARSDDE